MTLLEKIDWLHGHSILDIPYVGNVPGLPRLGLPPLNLEDGPQGVADAVSGVTCFPSAHTVAQTWSPDCEELFGRAMAEEQHAKGVNIALAPTANIIRVPWAGRSFEWVSEDPWLASRMVEAQVRGLQRGTNISGCVKHALTNSQETNRMSVSENVGERALRELYVPPFAAAVDAGVGYAMCAYSRLNGTYACESAHGIGMLKGDLGFAGALMSDWYATHSTAPAANAGLDQEMPGGFYLGVGLAAAVASGEVSAARLDDMVVRVLTPALALGLVGDAPSPSRNIFANASSADHVAVTRELAMRSITLLKNEGGLLPLAPRALARVAVFGDESTVAGEGSGGVTLPYVVTPAAGIAAALLAAGAGGVNVTYSEGRDAAAAAAAAAAADVAVVVVAVTSSEGVDRVDLALPAWQDALVSAVAAANARTVVVVRCPGACFMPWAQAVPAILFEGLAGQESGNSIGATLLGANNPSGRLAVSFPRAMNETWLSLPTVGGPVNPRLFPGTDRGRGFPEVDFDEGLFMGYRFYDAHEGVVSPLWPFGHGLGFSKFNYSDLRVEGSLSASMGGSANVSFTITHAGGPPGAEVAQLYVSHPASAQEPPQTLKGFSRVELQPGGSARVTLPLAAADLSVWPEDAAAWRLFEGAYGLSVGASSRDSRLKGSLVVAP